LRVACGRGDHSRNGGSRLLLDHLSGAKPYLTSSLYNLVSQIAPFEQKNKAEVLDAQPFEDAQIPASSVNTRDRRHQRQPREGSCNDPLLENDGERSRERGRHKDGARLADRRLHR
jgi:hypothetical protein